MQHPDDGTDVKTGSTHPDEGAIHAWLDGELSPTEMDALRTHLTECAECRVAVAEARGLVAASARILRSLDDGPGGIHANPSSGRSTTSASPAAGGEGRAVDATGQASSAPVVGGAGIRSIGDARTLRPAGVKGTTREGRRWRLSAIAAVGLMAVGTTLVLQRNGPLASFTAESTTDQVAGASPDAVASADSQQSSPSADIGGETETEAVTGGALSSSAGGTQARGAGAPTGSPEAEKVAAADEARPEAPPLAAPPRPPRPSAAVAAAGSNAEPDSAGMRAASAFVPPSPSARAAAPQAARMRAGLAATPAPVAAKAPMMAVGPVLVGRVTAEDGEPVAQALVTVPGTSSAAVTDIAGRFRLVGMPAGEHTATIRRMGFQPARLSLNVGERGDSVVKVALIPAESNLQDVVVTGVTVAPRQPAAESESARRAATGQAKAPSIIGPPVRPPAVEPSSISATTDSTPIGGIARLAPARRLAGCYRLEVGGASGASRDSVETALPGWIRLLDTPAPDRSGWLEATPLQRDQRMPNGSTGWRVAEGDEVEIVWPTASSAREVILRLLGSAEVLTGTAALRSVIESSTADEREAASIVAVRGVCN